MTLQRLLPSQLRAAFAPAFCIGLIALFAWHALAGETGLLALGEYRAEQRRLSAEADEIAAKRETLQNKLSLMGERAEPDYAEELVRRKLGFVRDDEIIVRLDE